MARFSALADSCKMGIRVRYSILEKLWKNSDKMSSLLGTPQKWLKKRGSEMV